MNEMNDRDTSETKHPRRHVARGAWAAVASVLFLACGSSPALPGDAGSRVDGGDESVDALADAAVAETGDDGDAFTEDGPAPDYRPAPDGRSAPDGRGPIPQTDVFTPEADPCGRPLGEVPPNRLIDLATVGPIMKLRYEAGRVLMLGLERWILWNPDQRAQLAAANLPTLPLSNGFTYGFVDMRGALLVTQTAQATFELHSSTDGAVTGVVNAETIDKGLAPDGSYFWTLTIADGLTVWSATGNKLASRAAVVAGGKVAALPGEVRIAYGDHVDRLNVADASWSSAPIPSGTFDGWFSDGAHFFTSGAGHGIYDAATMAQVAPITGGRFDGGYGDFVWRFASTTTVLELFSVSHQLASVATYRALEVVEVGRGRLGVVAPGDALADGGISPNVVKVIDLGRSTEVALTVPYTGGVWVPPAVAVDGRYVYGIGQQQRVARLDSGATLGCGYGEYAGADDGTVVVATDVGVLAFQLGEQTATTLGRFAVVGHRPEILADGSAVALANEDLPDYGAQMVSVLSLSTGTILHRWGRPDANGPVGPAALDPDYVVDFSLARNAPRLALSFLVQPTFFDARTVHVYLSDLAGKQMVEVPADTADIRLSPDGTRLLYGTSNREGHSTLLDAGQRSPAAGHASSWWDDTHYIARQYGRDSRGIEILTAPVLYDLQGVPSPSVSLPMDVDRAFVLSLGTYQHGSVVPLDGDRVFSATGAAVLDARSGARLWGKPALRCVAGRSAVTDVGGVVSFEAF